MRRVSYHQSVFDLLGIQPRESPQALEMVEACERRVGQRLPEAVRQWYLIDGVVALREDREEEGHLWYDYSNMDHPEPLEAVLRQFAPEDETEAPPWGRERIRLLIENQAVCSWFLQPDGGSDPPVVVDEDYDMETSRVLEWVRVADRFSAFLFDWFARFYFKDYTPLSERSSYPEKRTRPPDEKSYLNGLWLYAPEAEALAPPSLDYLIDHFAEEPRQEVAAGVMQYNFRDDQGGIRVTTDGYGEEEGVSAWWLHAGSEEGLYRLARKVWRCGNLPAAMRHWTKAARLVRDRLREAERG